MARPLIVVGAGSAGAVIATRVTEDPQKAVTLLEAGPDYPGDLAGLPMDLRNGRRNSTEAHDWGYRFSPNRIHDLSPLPRGKVTGGSSAVNTCIALRGQPYDFAEWAERAGSQWEWEACLPAFRRLETDLDIDNAWHGQSGPIHIRRHPRAELVPMQAAFLDACAELGWPECADHNDPHSTGAGSHAMNKVDGVRISTAMGYLPLARGRSNLRIEPHTLVDRVVFRGNKVCAIEMLKAGHRERRPCDKVVLCGGSIATPGILMRSGIGPRAVLERMGVELRVDAPVGIALVDHPGAVMLLAPKPGFCQPDAPLIQTTMRYASAGGPGDNDMQLQPVSFVQLPLMPLLCALTVCVGKTTGTGTLIYRSADPHAKPHIVSGLGEDPVDRERAREGLRMAAQVVAQGAYRGAVKRVWPDDEMLTREDTEWLLPGMGSGYHPCGTARMGEVGDPLAVVDGYGRVHGVEGLFVADASVMPTVPSANLNLPTIMLGERFGEWFREGVL